MPTRTLSLKSTGGLKSITFIECGVSVPKLGGSIDISTFTNLTGFTCANNFITELNGYSTNTNLQFLNFADNRITGSLPSLSAMTGLKHFQYNRNITITGPIPSLNELTNLQFYNCANNEHTGSIPSLSGLTNLANFNCSLNDLTGSIPNLSELTNLTIFACNNNFGAGNRGISNFSGSVPNKLRSFQAQINRLTQIAVNAILAAFVDANSTGGTLNLGGVGNSAPSSEGVSKTTLAGTVFSRSGNLVTVTYTAHGYNTDDWVTVTDITQTDFQGTFSVTRISNDIFQYSTVSSGTLTGSGTATLRKTSTGNTSGFRSYQSLTRVGRIGGIWSVGINFPA